MMIICLNNPIANDQKALTRCGASVQSDPSIMSQATTLICTAIGLLLFADILTTVCKLHKPDDEKTIIKSIKDSTRTEFDVVTNRIMTVHAHYWLAGLRDRDGATIVETKPCKCEHAALSELEVMMRTY